MTSTKTRKSKRNMKLTVTAPPHQLPTQKEEEPEIDFNKSSNQQIYEYNQSLKEKTHQIVQCIVCRMKMRECDIDQHFKDCNHDHEHNSHSSKHDISLNIKYRVLTMEQRRNRTAYRWVEPQFVNPLKQKEEESSKRSVKSSNTKKSSKKRKREEMEANTGSTLLVINAPPPCKKHKRRRFSKSPMTEMFDFLDAFN